MIRAIGSLSQIKIEEPVWHECYEGESGDYTATISLKDKSIYGTIFDYETGERFTTSLYVMIDGILYGAENDNQEIIFGALYDNPLISNNNGFLIPLGYVFNVGVTFKDDDLYLYCAQCGWASDQDSIAVVIAWLDLDIF